MHRMLLVLLAAAALALPGCEVFGIGTPSTRALESGVQDSLSPATRTYELHGFYTQTQAAPPPPLVSGARFVPPPTGARWSMDLQLDRGALSKHLLLSTGSTKLEAIVLANSAYFRGQDFLSQFLSGDPATADLVKAAGNGWWRGPAGLVPQLPDLTDGTLFRVAFLGSAVRDRTDHVQVDGLDTVELSGPRADVYISSSAPYRLVRVVIPARVTVDGIGRSDLHYSNYGKDFGIAAPADVIDFSNLSTLPPIYTVIAVNTSRCTSPCVVSALLKNLGGPTGAKAPSTVTFTMKDSATGTVAGSCTVSVVPDVGYTQTTSVSCTIPLAGSPPNAAIVTATADNPGRG